MIYKNFYFKSNYIEFSFHRSFRIFSQSFFISSLRICSATAPYLIDNLSCPLVSDPQPIVPAPYLLRKRSCQLHICSATDRAPSVFPPLPPLSSADLAPTVSAPQAVYSQYSPIQLHQILSASLLHNLPICIYTPSISSLLPPTFALLLFVIHITLMPNDFSPLLSKSKIKLQL